jgi:hypothetical protein
MLRTPFKLFSATIAPMIVVISILPIAGWRDAYPEEEIPALLQVRITSPPRWENGCLTVRVDRTNQSSVPIFLSDMGPYLDMALDVSTPEASTANEYEWVNLHGVSDIISLDGAPLAPGVTVHDNFCLGPLVWVVNLKKETRREIPVRGQLRVRVSYFLSEDALKRYKDWFNESPPYRAARESHDLPADIAPKWATVFAEIPCSDATCKSGCGKPPTGIAGEVRPVPDVFFLTPEWDSRGKVVTDDLAHKFPPCAVENPAYGKPLA